MIRGPSILSDDLLERLNLKEIGKFLFFFVK
jgi:hypothetical protein